MQLEPVFGDIAASLARVDALLASASSGSLDIVVLPEMALTGYTFAGRDQVLALSELCGRGRTHAWAAGWATRLRAHVVVGYAERESDAPTARLFNSQMMVATDGTVCLNHRKKHLFATDQTWASEGDCWTHGVLSIPSAPLSRVRVSLGVCMDINPWRFQAPWADYELAQATLAHRSSMLLFSSAWCDRSPDDPEDYCPPPVDAAAMLQYWAARLQPLAEQPRTTHFVCCDRVGQEGSTTFCGCSCVMALGGGTAALRGALGVHGEGLLIRDIDADSDYD